MNLVLFMMIASLISLSFGEFGQFPFGLTRSVGITDGLLFLNLIFLAIWRIGILKKIDYPRPFKFLILFWAVSFLSLILSGNLNGGLYLVRFVIYSSNFLIGFYIIKSKVSKVDSIILLLVILGLFLSILGFLQLLIFPNIGFLSEFGYDPHIGRLVSTFLDPNLLGTFLNITLALSFYRWLKDKGKINFFITIVLLLAIFLTFSRSAYLMLIVQTLILGLLKDKRILFTIFLFAMIFSLTIPRLNERIIGAFKFDQTSTDRIESWGKGIKIFEKHPLLGVGFNNIRDAYDKEKLLQTFTIDGGNSGSGVDSSAIFVFATTGVIGFLSYAFFWFILIKSIFKLKDKLVAVTMISIIVSLFINSQFINSLFYPPIMFVYFLLLGGIYGLLD